HEKVGDDGIFHMIPKSPLDGKPLSTRNERIGAYDPDSPGPVRIPCDNGFPECGRMAAGGEWILPAGNDARLFLRRQELHAGNAHIDQRRLGLHPHRRDPEHVSTGYIDISRKPHQDEEGSSRLEAVYAGVYSISPLK